MIEWSKTDVAIFGRNLALFEQESDIQTFKHARIWLEHSQGCGSRWTIMVQRSKDAKAWKLAQGHNRMQARYALRQVENFQWGNLGDCRRQIEEASWLPYLFTGAELVCWLLLGGLLGLLVWYEA